MLTLNDGRKELYQWDTGRTATVDIECDVVHFSNLKYGESLAVEVKEGKVAIPNKLLMIGEPIYCWAFVKDEGGAYTKKEQTFVVAKRAKPSDYVYTETETLTWKSLDERITELEKGGTGGSDAVKYTEQYLTDEQKAQARTNIGAVSVDEVPIATNDVAGVVKPVSKTDGMTQPVGVDENGVLFTVPPGGSGDMQKSVYDPNNRAKDIFEYADDSAKLAVTNHASSGDAHSDIRNLITGLTNRLNALADSDDTTLDQMSEIVAYIKSNKSLIDAITTEKVSVSDIIDNLTTNVTNKPLSAAQGVALKALIDGITIPEKLPNPNALTFTGAVTGSYDGSAAVTVNVPSGGGSGGTDISLGMTGATVGQIAKITSVDDNGVPTAWEAIDVPSGGSGGDWEVFYNIITEEEAASITIELPTRYKRLRFIVEGVPVNETNTTLDMRFGNSTKFRLQINNGVQKIKNRPCQVILEKTPHTFPIVYTSVNAGSSMTNAILFTASDNIQKIDWGNYLNSVTMYANGTSFGAGTSVIIMGCE